MSEHDGPVRRAEVETVVEPVGRRRTVWIETEDGWRVAGLDADALRRQADEIAAANEELAPFRVLRGVECDIRADGSLDRVAWRTARGRFRDHVVED